MHYDPVAVTIDHESGKIIGIGVNQTVTPLSVKKIPPPTQSLLETGPKKISVNRNFGFRNHSNRR